MTGGRRVIISGTNSHHMANILSAIDDGASLLELERTFFVDFVRYGSSIREIAACHLSQWHRRRGHTRAEQEQERQRFARSEHYAVRSRPGFDSRRAHMYILAFLSLSSFFILKHKSVYYFTFYMIELSVHIIQAIFYNSCTLHAISSHIQCIFLHGTTMPPCV